MTSISQQILKNHQVRNTDKQKEDFRKFIREEFPEIIVEPESDTSTHNLVLGNIKTAKLIITAHYDTPQRLRYPKTSFPKNRLANHLHKLFFAFLGIIAMLPLLIGFLLFTADGLASYVCTLAVCAVPLIAIFKGLGPNPKNANDNTSGIVTLCELYNALSEYERSQVAIVFFDNEERRLAGSKLFKKLHPEVALDEILLINFDCVANGNHMLFAFNQKAYEDFKDIFEEVYKRDANREPHFENRETARYSSDQLTFGSGVGIVALREKFGLLYLSRIHTVKDTVFEYENIEYLVEGTKQLINILCKPPVE